MAMHTFRLNPVSVRSRAGGNAPPFTQVGSGAEQTVMPTLHPAGIRSGAGANACPVPSPGWDQAQNRRPTPFTQLG